MLLRELAWMTKPKPSPFHQRLRGIEVSLRHNQGYSLSDRGVAAGAIGGQAMDCSNLGGQFGFRFAASLHDCALPLVRVNSASLSACRSAISASSVRDLIQC
jgi:hypothetical protein